MTAATGPEGRIARRVRLLLRTPLDRAGYYLLRKHYYLPIPDANDRTAPFLESDSALPGVHVDAERAFALFAQTTEPALP
jgi:hypothetical protein